MHFAIQVLSTITLMILFSIKVRVNCAFYLH
jgi:hypothetical protein